MKKKKKIIITTIIVLALTALWGGKTYLSSKNTFKTVDTAEVVKTTLIQSVSVSGNIKALESEEISLPSGQKITKVLVEEGQEVKKGQLLVKLDTYDLETQLKKGKISLEMSKRNLEKLKAENSAERKSLENAVTQAELALKSAASKYEDAKVKHEQTKKLYEAGFVSKSDYDNSQSSLKDLETNFLTAEIALDNAKNALADFDNRIYEQEKQIEMSSTELASIEKKIAESNIKANINGKIIKLDAKEGQYPAEGSNIIIHDQSKYILELKVSQYDSVSMKLGMKANIKLSGLDKIYEGHVTKIAETAIVETSTNSSSKETKLLVEVTMDNADEQIRAGYEADAEIILVEKENSLAVSFDAVKTDEQGNKYIFVVEDNIAKKRIVETGLQTDLEIEIISGLKEGEKYILNPPAGLMDGETVMTTGGI
ncbi:efflux RND transporter periplasmic adaptor subunit [Lutispora thermophila]|uniref:Biotin-lipoyl like n=1 Tax=Lutispora thermophila DSM 19022 TaxID=1122184 RepID=A0A1M6C0B5_9FIRM|nr:HlyD family efflux transporter periplasmic adaptor subunit [Lutispora thermophila]SHI54466.1 Biotin-lipoyl like [Lutispora thermophila DSM 19022]